MGSQNFVKILAIETSCDETAIALVDAKGGLRQPNFKVLKNIISSQIKIHRPFGGVVPSLAKREHLKNLPVVLQKALSPILYGRTEWEMKEKLNNIGLIAVTVGPGLEPALWTGINFAKELAKKYKKPLIGVNHLEGHMYSFLLKQKAVISKSEFRISNIYPAIVLIVSGGHTILIYQKNYDFSFSGLKTAVLYYLRDHPKIREKDVAASFQQAIIDVLIQKTIRAASEYKVRSVILSGGVASNKALQKRLRAECRKNKLSFLSAERKYQTDNAAMIAVAAYIGHLRGRKPRITAQANLNL